jgi:PHD/YefM family antitoxin component YafN of YafNO toxin-antitoxin module
MENVAQLVDFQNNPNRYVDELSKSKQPLFLTQSGKSSIVLLDADYYQQLLDRMDFMQSVAEGLEDYRLNRTVPAKEVFASIEQMIDKAEQQ